MTFIDNHNGIERPDHLNQCRFVRIGQQHGLVLHIAGEGGKIAVFLIGFAPFLFAGTEGVIAQYENGKLIGNRRGVEILSGEKLLFGINLHRAAKIHVDFPAIGMIGIAECREGLAQNRVGGNEPHDRPDGQNRHSVKDGFDCVCREKGLAAACRHFEAHVRHKAREVVMIGRQAVCADNDVLFFPQGLVGTGSGAGFRHQREKPRQVTNDVFLIIFQFQVRHLLTVLRCRAGFF